MLGGTSFGVAALVVARGVDVIEASVREVTWGRGADEMVSRPASRTVSSGLASATLGTGAAVFLVGFTTAGLTS